MNKFPCVAVIHGRGNRFGNCEFGDCFEYSICKDEEQLSTLKKLFDGPDYYRTVLIIPIENADNLYFDDKGDYVKLENYAND